MAQLSSDKTYVVVEGGDTLSEIALKYLGNDNKYKLLASINGIKDPDYIYVDQKIYLTKAAYLAANAKTTSTTSTYSPTITGFGQSTSDSSKLFVTWTFTKPSWTEEFVVVWRYWVRGLDGSYVDTKTVEPNADSGASSWISYFDIPDKLWKVNVTITPTSKYKDEEKKTKYFTAGSTTSDMWSTMVTLTAPSSPPDVEVNGCTVTASVKDIDIDEAKYIQFQLSQVDKTTGVGQYAPIVNQRASCQFTVEADYDYFVRCRAANSNNSRPYVSEWTNYSSIIKTIPSSIKHISSLERTEGSTVLVQWPALTNVTEYTVQYTTNEAYFDASSDVKSETVESNKVYLTGLSEGNTYYVRIRATNDQGSSGWVNTLEDGTVASIVLGNAPSAPTTWSSTTTATVGEAVNLYWVHNSSDGSTQTAATLMLYVYSDYNSSTPDDSYEIDITSYIPASSDDDDTDDTICKYVLSSVNVKDTVSSVDVEYYLSTSTTALSGGSWSTTAPTWVDGKYMWSRTVTVDGLGNKTYSPSRNGVCIVGAAGSDGKSVASIVEQYYQSTSATSLIGGSWSTTYPGWVDGKYIWTRSAITYTDGTTSTTTPICVSNKFSDGYEVRWQIRTCGVTEEYSAWSALRSVRFYAPATLQLNMVNADGTGVGMTAEDIDGVWYFDQITEYRNQIPVSTGASDVGVYNNVGYKEDTAVNSAAGPVTSNGVCLTGYIPCKVGDVVRLSNLDIGPNVTNSKVAFYTSSKIYIGLITGGSTWYWNNTSNEDNFEAVSDSDGNYTSLTIKSIPGITEDCAYMRIVAANITQDSIVTVNDEAIATLSLNFTSDGESFIGISISTLGDDPYMKYSREDGTDVLVWGRGDDGLEWVDTAYKSITVSDGTDTALEFLNAVASKREFGDGTLTSFPFTITAIAGPATQKPMSYHLSIVSNDDYTTTDEVGKSRTVKTGDEIYSKVFDVIEGADYIADGRDLSATLSAGDIDLQNGCEYTPTCIVAMDSGLMAEATLPSFMVNWTDVSFTPGALITIDQDTLTANIMPYCENLIMRYYQVSLDSGVYTKSPLDLGFVYGELVDGAMTTTEEQVYSGMTGDGDEVYFCKVLEEQSVENVWLSVYRREFDGSFTKINDTDIDAGKNTTVVDPHPALDYARYRIVAKTKTTGAVTYYDLPGEYVGGTAIVIQWDEAWTNFEVNEDSTPEQPAWSGSMLKLPYNIDVTESNVSDKTSIEYIGRAHPVVYYGTQLGVSATWSVDIPKEDKETLYALRRLSRWMGDVYVREPSGSGYWATIDVSFTQKHTEKTIPVSISITQVEGGA